MYASSFFPDITLLISIRVEKGRDDVQVKSMIDFVWVKEEMLKFVINVKSSGGMKIGIR